MSEFPGYTVRETIVTHLSTLTPDAESAAGSVKILKKEAALALWERVKVLLSRYRDGWSLDNIAARRASAQTIYASLPETGWLIKALDVERRFISTDRLCTDWTQSSNPL